MGVNVVPRCMSPSGSPPRGSSRLPTPFGTDVRYWAPAIAVSLTTFVIVVNASLMNVAIPTMVAEFDTTVTTIQGAVSLYSLVIAALPPSSVRKPAVVV